MEGVFPTEKGLGEWTNLNSETVTDSQGREPTKGDWDFDMFDT